MHRLIPNEKLEEAYAIFNNYYTKDEKKYGKEYKKSVKKLRYNTILVALDCQPLSGYMRRAIDLFSSFRIS
ncbi:MAG: hypothetical protein JKY24_08260 [Pseudomonadales bacterium]|nr:hypothetical protein [Pseudomonadales bacterium]